MARARGTLPAVLVVAAIGCWPGCQCQPPKPLCAEVPAYDECRTLEHCVATLTDGPDGPGWDCELRPGHADGVPLAQQPVILPDGIEVECPAGTALAGDKRTSAWCEKPDGTRHGPLRAWDRATGRLLQATRYVDGVEHGLRQRWHDNGRLQSRSALEHGVTVGVAEGWHDNGRPSYREDTGSGLIEWWRPDGTKFKEARFRDGKELWQRNLEDGRLGEKERTEPTPDGGERRYFYYLDDRPRMEYGIKDGELEGPSFTWYPDGARRSSASYQAGLLQGTYVEWDQQGRVVRECQGPEVTFDTCTYLNGYTLETAPRLPPGVP